MSSSGWRAAVARDRLDGAKLSQSSSGWPSPPVESAPKAAAGSSAAQAPRLPVAGRCTGRWSGGARRSSGPSSSERSRRAPDFGVSGLPAAAIGAAPGPQSVPAGRRSPWRVQGAGASPARAAAMLSYIRPCMQTPRLLIGFGLRRSGGAADPSDWRLCSTPPG